MLKLPSNLWRARGAWGEPATKLVYKPAPWEYFSCWNCGGHVRAKDLHCEHCGSTFVSVTCPDPTEERYLKLVRPDLVFIESEWC